ncbi:hypothetical protein MTO96_020098 [Rhipicephalus appendiculatus]
MAASGTVATPLTLALFTGTTQRQDFGFGRAGAPSKFPSRATLVSVIIIGTSLSACLGLGTVLLRSAGSQARPAKFSLRARHERRRAGIAAVTDFAPEKSPGSSPYPASIPGSITLAASKC